MRRERPGQRYITVDTQAVAPSVRVLQRWEHRRMFGIQPLIQRARGVKAIEESVTIRRGLAQARPDAFLPDLAMSLNNQSLRLADLGRREQALEAIAEAVTIYRGLAEAHPDVFLPVLATSLDNRSRIEDGAQ